MPDQEPIPGYVRSGTTHIETRWQFEVLSEAHKVAFVTIETDDGNIHIGLNRREAESLLQQLQLFLLDWPQDGLT